MGFGGGEGGFDSAGGRADGDGKGPVVDEGDDLVTRLSSNRNWDRCPSRPSIRWAKGYPRLRRFKHYGGRGGDYGL